MIVPASSGTAAFFPVARRSHRPSLGVMKSGSSSVNSKRLLCRKSNSTSRSTIAPLGMRATVRWLVVWLVPRGLGAKPPSESGPCATA